MDDSNIISQLKSQGFTVEDAGQGEGVHLVSKDGEMEVLDLTSEEAMHDSLASIKAKFGLAQNEPIGQGGFAMMRQTMTNTGKLAQRVAATGESVIESVQAVVIHRGVTRHYTVRMAEGQVRINDMAWPVKDFMAKSGSTPMINRQDLVNADEIRDALVGQ